MPRFVIRATLNAAGIVTAFLLCATAAALQGTAAPGAAQLFLLVLLAGSSAVLAHATGQAAVSSMVTGLSALPFAAWLFHRAWTGSDPVASLVAGALMVAAFTGAWAGRRMGGGLRWREGHSATVLLTLTAVLLVILSPLLLMMPR